MEWGTLAFGKPRPGKVCFWCLGTEDLVQDMGFETHVFCHWWNHLYKKDPKLFWKDPEIW